MKNQGGKIMNDLLLNILESDEQSVYNVEKYKEIYSLLFQTNPATGSIEQRLVNLIEE